MGSGKGSNFRAILDVVRGGALGVEIAVVLSDEAAAGILTLARGAGIAARVIGESKFRTKLSPDVEAGVVEALRREGVELVVLAGYMRMVGAPLLEAYPRRIINIHPSLLPKYPGLEAWRQALEAGEAVTGCTVHFVDAGMDTGEVIEQSEVSVLAGDTAESLHERIQLAEHVLLPRVIGRFARREIA